MCNFAIVSYLGDAKVVEAANLRIGPSSAIGSVLFC